VSLGRDEIRDEIPAGYVSDTNMSNAMTGTKGSMREKSALVSTREYRALATV
jgi:hypothetical protein